MEIKNVTDYIRKNVVKTDIISKSYIIQDGKILATSNPHIAQFYNSEGKCIGMISKVHGGALSKNGGICTTITTFTDNLKRNFQKIVRQYFKKIQIINNSKEIVIIPERIVTDIKEINFEKKITKKVRKVRELETHHELNKEYPNFVKIYTLKGKAKYTEEIIEELEEPYKQHKPIN